MRLFFQVRSRWSFNLFFDASSIFFIIFLREYFFELSRGKKSGGRGKSGIALKVAAIKAK
jgi:hypothetical protein